MNKAVGVSLLAIALLIVPAEPSSAWGGHGGHGFHGHGFHGHFHGRGVIVVGPGCCWGPWWGWGWGGYYPPPYYYQPQVIVQPAPVYTDSGAPPQSYWYYCPSAKGYYPTVPTCPEVWIKVPPR